MTVSVSVRTGGDLLVDSLTQHGVDTLFALPGVQLDGAFAALHRAQDRIRVIHPRHEQTTAYMADGYARVSGKMGVCMVVPGPGVLNASAAISTAYANASPVLVLAGQLNRDTIDAGLGNLHEIRDQLGMMRHITKYAERAAHPQDIAGAISNAVHEMWNGYVRPVLVEVPWDTLHEPTTAEAQPPLPQRLTPAPDPEQIEAAARLLRQAKRPLIITGAAINNENAFAELQELAERLQAPVMGIHNGKGALGDHHYLSHSALGGRYLMESADVILLVGTRLSASNQFPWSIEPERTYIQVDPEASQIGHNVPVAAGIVGDARQALAGLLHALPEQRESREEEMLEVKRLADAALDAIQPQGSWARAIRNAIPDDGIVVNDMTQISYWGNLGWPTYAPRTFLTTGYQGTLGWAYPTSLGAKVAAGDRVVVSISGDGGFGYCLNELATQAQHGIAAISIVFDDNGFGNVRRMQQELYGGAEIASHLRNPDYVQLAESFGISGRRAETPQALARQIEESIKANEPTLIEVPTEPMPNTWSNLRIR